MFIYSNIMMLWFFLFIKNINAFIDSTNIIPHCSKCMWFVPNVNKKPEDGFCKMFVNIKYVKGKTIEKDEYAVHCRKNDYQCGPEAYLFESKDDTWNLVYKRVDNHLYFLKQPIQNKENNQEKNFILQDLEEKMRELEDQISGEVNEKKDLEEIDREYIFLTEKIQLLRKLQQKTEQ